MSAPSVVMVRDMPWRDCSTYTGRLVNAKRDGSGTARNPDGSISYEGDWRDDKRHGRGASRTHDGDAYDGEWLAGAADGWGTLRHADGSWYEGLWRAGSWKWGTWHHGVDEVEGEWNGGPKQGWGVQRRKRENTTNTTTNNNNNVTNNNNNNNVMMMMMDTVYEGEWDRNQWHGVGMWRSPDGSGDMYHGVFDHGRRSGTGSMMFGCGGSYVGRWKDDVFHGRGARIWEDGTRYEGEWVMGKEHGAGRKTWGCEGTALEGLWEAGAIKSGTMKWPNGDEFTGTFTVEGVGEGTATLKSGDGSVTSKVEGTLKMGVLQVNGVIVHHMGRGDAHMEKEVRRLQTEILSLKQSLQDAQQKLDEKTQCFDHTLKHIQHGVWTKCVDAPQQEQQQSEDVLITQEEGRRSRCVMRDLFFKLENHTVSFGASVCAMCPLDKVVKMEVEKRFGVDENQQVVSFSLPSMDQGTCNATLLPGNASSFSLFPHHGIPGMTVRITPVMAISEPDLKIVCPLGSGSYGTVFKCLHRPSGREVAVKTMHEVLASDKNVQSFMLEAEIVSGLRHPNIVKCIGTSITSVTGKLQIVSELMCCSLRQLLKQKKRLSIHEVSAISLNIAKGMDSLHRQNFMHRDLSSNNVLFDSNGIPKICDFGVSRTMDHQPRTIKTIVPGTPVYMAPQMFTPDYSLKGDIWGFGILMTEMLNGDIVDSPFDKVPIESQANFIIEQKRLLSPPEVEEVDTLRLKMLSQKSGDSAIVQCVSRRKASIDAVILITHPPDSPNPATTSQTAAELIVLVVKSCLSILQRDRVPFAVIAKLMLCCCSAIVSHTSTTPDVQVTDDQVNESITLWLNSLIPFILTAALS
ncbi:2-isopropylmalate synthase [Pelomyxa schiedti]|nr:2-isopropylmalate synthase [Pelomyxa schiedti]